MTASLKLGNFFIFMAGILAMPAFIGCAHATVQKGGAVMTENKTNNNYGPLASVAYSKGGGSQGGRYFLELIVENNGKCHVDIEDKEFWNSPEKKESRYVEGSCLARLQEIIEKSGITSWADLPRSEIMVFDAPTTSISIIYSAGQVFNINDRQALPENWYDVFGEIKKILTDCR